MPALVSYTHACTHTCACTHTRAHIYGPLLLYQNRFLIHQCIYHVQCLVAIYFMLEPRDDYRHSIPDNSSMGKPEHLDNQIRLSNIYPKRALESLDHSRTHEGQLSILD